MVMFHPGRNEGSSSRTLECMSGKEVVDMIVHLLVFC